MIPLAVDSNGAAGSPISQIIIAVGAATLLTLVLLWLGLGHRSGKVKILGRAAGMAERATGLPGWSALPTFLATTSLLIAVFGMYWDISLHIDVGRDPGPLANPAHYFILFGLFGIFTSGYVGVMLTSRGRDVPGTTGLHLTPRWRAPLGAVLITACGAFALIGFPLDDVWHRIFGQDVTLWGPTHLMLIGGASMTLIGLAVIVTEGLRANDRTDGERVERAWFRFARRIALGGGLLLGLSTFQGEWDFGIPQFRMVFQPEMIMIATGVGLVATRIWAGRGAALGAVLFFLGVRGILALIVGPILGETTPATPLYLVEAVLVELVALRISTTRPVTFGLVCGLLIGTIGFASEWAWSQLVMPIPMNGALASIAIPYGFVAAMSAALVGAWIGTRLLTEPVPHSPALRRAAVIGAIGIGALVAVSLPKPPIPGESATITLRPAALQPGDKGYGARTVMATVKLTPSTAGDDAQWLSMTSWQGGGLLVDHLKKVGPGVYETNRPFPVSGSWKAMVRLERGRSLMVVPVFLPKDTAIPAAEVPALAQFTRPFVADHKVLQREQKGKPASITSIAYLTIGLLAFALLVLLVWGLHRLANPPAPRVRRAKQTAAAQSPGSSASPTASA